MEDTASYTVVKNLQKFPKIAIIWQQIFRQFLTWKCCQFWRQNRNILVSLELCAGTLSELMLPSKEAGVTPLYRQAKVNVWVNMATFLFVDASSCMPPSSSSKEQPRAVPKLKKKTLWHGFLSPPLHVNFFCKPNSKATSKYGKKLQLSYTSKKKSYTEAKDIFKYFTLFEPFFCHDSVFFYPRKLFCPIENQFLICQSNLINVLIRVPLS